MSAATLFGCASRRPGRPRPLRPDRRIRSRCARSSPSTCSAAASSCCSASSRAAGAAAGLRGRSGAAGAGHHRHRRRLLGHGAGRRAAAAAVRRRPAGPRCAPMVHAGTRADASRDARCGRLAETTTAGGFLLVLAIMLPVAGVLLSLGARRASGGPHRAGR